MCRTIHIRASFISDRVDKMIKHIWWFSGKPRNGVFRKVSSSTCPLSCTWVDMDENSQSLDGSRYTLCSDSKCNTIFPLASRRDSNISRIFALKPAILASSFTAPGTFRSSSLWRRSISNSSYGNQPACWTFGLPLLYVSKVAGILKNYEGTRNQILKKERFNERPLLVCSGGTTSRAAADNCWTLDLRKRYKEVKYNPTEKTVEIEGGVKMKEWLESKM